MSHDKIKEIMTRKLYCYVDETGQDTKGTLFISVAIIVGAERDESDEHIRLADAVAGFARDHVEKHEYLRELYMRAIRKGMIREEPKEPPKIKKPPWVGGTA